MTIPIEPEEQLTPAPNVVSNVSADLDETVPLAAVAPTASLTTPLSLHHDPIMHGGPLFHFLSKLGAGFGNGRTKMICFAYMLATWGVMAILCAAQGVFFNPAIRIPFCLDISEACRFLIVGPLLIAAEPMIEPWLRNVVIRFDALTPTDEKQRLTAFRERAKRMRDLWWVELLLVLFAVLRPHFDPSIALTHEMTSWQFVGSSVAWAKVWSDFVAKPMMGVLWLRWLWKYIVWSLLLCRIAGLNLRLVPTHPDDMAGLGFVCVGQAKFTVLVISLAILVASADADEIVYGSMSFMSQRWIILLVAVLALVIFLTPLLAFTPKLSEVKRKGLFEYGRLAQEYVTRFESKWIDHRDDCHEEILGHGDIQTLADLESAYNIVQRMKVVLIDRSLLTIFVLSAALPFAPLALTMLSLEQWIDRLFKRFI